jgi:hypothetical protein
MTMHLQAIRVGAESLTNFTPNFTPRYDREKVESLLDDARRLVDASEMANRPRCMAS